MQKSLMPVAISPKVFLFNDSFYSNPLKKKTEMKVADLKKVHKAFSLSKSKEIYLREKEVLTIESFVNSEQMVLHICGNPGTGKTHVVTQLLKKSSLYLNYYNEDRISVRIKDNRRPVVVIDEFDRYYNERRSECLQNMRRLKSRNVKLITVSNNLRISSDALFFEPYTSSDMEKILIQKLKKESPVNIAASTVTRLISKKMGSSGDLRLLFKYIQEILERKLLNNDITEISVEDVALDKENEASVPNDIHHCIISTLMSKSEETSRMKLYSKYLRECSEVRIQGYDRTDFNIICDMYS